MLSYREELSKELGEIAPGQFIEPEEEIQKEDHAAGEASIEIKRIFTLRKRTADLGNKYIGKLNPKDGCDKRNKIMGKIHELRRKTRILTDFLWASIDKEFNLLGKKNTGIRKGFVVVWTDKNDNRDEDCNIPTIVKISGKAGHGIKEVLPLIFALGLMSGDRILPGRDDE